MKEFTTNPLKWKVTGNIIGEELGTIRLIDNWGETPSRVDHGLTREIGGHNIRFARVEYMDLLYESGADVHMNVATGGDYLENLNGVRTYQGGGSVTVELSNEWSNKGKYSFKGIYGGLTSGEQISFLGHVNEALPVTPGDEITIIINYKSINSVRLGVGWRDNNFTPVKSDYVVLPATPDGGTGSITVTTPAGIEFMIVTITNTTSPVANTVYVDNIKIKTSEPEPYVPVVTVSGVVPGNGTENVPIDQSIVVTFDDNIEAGSAYANITVKNPGGTSMSINKTISGNKLTITGSWLNNILYTLTIPINGIKDFLAGLTTTFKTVPETPPPTQPALPVYGLYVNDTVTPNAVNELTVANLNSRGITDLFILTPLGSIDTRLNPWITKFGSSDIRLHAWVTCFKDSNGWFNPNPSVEPTKLNTIKTHIQTIINDKNVDGINLDSVRYPGGGSLIANNHNGTYHVTNFVEDIKTRINTHNDVTGANQILLSTCLMPETDWSNKYYYGQSYSDHAEHTDFIAPMVYGYDYNFGEGGIEGRTAYIKDKSGKNNTVSTITTYKGDNDTTPLTSTELTNDKAAVQAGGSQGYILFRYGLLHTGW